MNTETTESIQSKVAIDSINIGERHRKKLGDIDTLMQSIDEIGLLHPIIIDPDYNLIAGGRRLEACKQLGWTEIPVNIVPLKEIALGEFAENALREDFTPSEMVAIFRAVKPLEAAKAKERHDAQAMVNIGLADKVDYAPSEKGRVSDKVAKAVGTSRYTLKNAEAIVEAAESDPDKYGDLVKLMDEDGKVEPVYKALQRRRNVHPRNETRVVFSPSAKSLIARFDAVGNAISEFDPTVVKDNAEFERLQTEGEALENAIRDFNQNIRLVMLALRESAEVRTDSDNGDNGQPVTETPEMVLAS